ncbi:hypothetical protein CPC08DRAFT_754504 [Agrocybe pediades]|nr:hypothetical protein CPC08DRAFT_754504 [Agrocybe pediades]
MAPFPIRRFIKTDPADAVVFEKGLKSYQQYNATHQFEDLHNAIQSYQSCLDLRLETRKDLAARGRPESREFSDKIAKVYLSLTIVLLSQYEKQPTPANLQRLARVESYLLKEWGTDHPQNYVSILYNVATAYNRGYSQATSQLPPSAFDPPNDTSILNPTELFKRACTSTGTILLVNQPTVPSISPTVNSRAPSFTPSQPPKKRKHSREALN